MMITTGNLFSDTGRRGDGEEIVELLATPQVRIERIASLGAASPPGFWYDQERAEWVVLLAGAARLVFAGEAAPRELKPGDWLHIPPHARHRVDWTDQAAVWLAVHHA